MQYFMYQISKKIIKQFKYLIVMFKWIDIIFLDVINVAESENKYQKFLCIDHDDLYAIYMQKWMVICMQNNIMKISKNEK